MSPALPTWLPDRRDISYEFVTAVIVGTTLYVFDGSFGYAVAGGAGFLVLRLLTDIAENAVGDYADNALYGLLVLAGTAYAAAPTTPLWLVATGAVLGGWFLADGVQHLRHGVTRAAVGTPYTHEGSALTGLPKALAARLAEPILLETRDQQ
ncbi:hypothetical protein IL252_05210 [Halomicrobium sp. IBSBa]|uniref:hypothetical protein n=1 Tax=Halomicrobium sp. IBSBa TaxID=2778916 RepID=UPI001AC00019|nr:hypothetical protein [Halomicrobium sp. IBSBa]MBO4247218.1 hypothetical protein [Halomicrobium sp. IBSBa]